ncbi:MAG: alpha/beta hydrolase [Dehalococcoidia bacterium]|nr:alpha/beta hydrolase [Dehalococcoidia bacterium]
MPPAVLPTDLQHRYADVNGIRMHYVEAGSGEPVVFLHGFPETWYSWRHQIAALAPDYRVIAPDLRGYNETEAREPYDTGTLQEDVLGLIRELGETRVHLVAHDWGGAIAWLLGMYHPEALRTLTVCNLPHPALMAEGLKRPRQMMRSWYIAFFQLPWLPERALALRNYHLLARVLINDCRPGTYTREDIKHYLESWRRSGLRRAAELALGRVPSRRRQPMRAPLPTISDADAALILGRRGHRAGQGAHVRN